MPEPLLVKVATHIVDRLPDLHAVEHIRVYESTLLAVDALRPCGGGGLFAAMGQYDLHDGGREVACEGEAPAVVGRRPPEGPPALAPGYVVAGPDRVLGSPFGGLCLGSRPHARHRAICHTPSL